MDLATLIGMVISFGMISAAIISGSSFVLFLDLASVLIVFGGTLGAVLTQYPLGTVFNIGRVIRKTLIGRTPSTTTILDQFADLSNRARREGILSLESVVGSLHDPYLKTGLQLTVDGLEPESIQAILEAEINSVESRHETGIELMNAFASYAPAFGMLGTVIGLVQMMQTMSDPSTIGPAMAIALITTFYGSLLANLVFLPMAGKLKHRSKEEIHIMEMQMEGILGISRGENPRIIEQKLSSFLPYKDRKTI